MGTPRLLRSVDQIRNEQRTASVSDECPPTTSLESRNFWLATSTLGTVRGNATGVTFTLLSELDFARGCAGDDLCSLDVAQQVLFAQQRD
jgi:hypothetical protein